VTLSYTVRPISDRTPFTGQPEHSQFTATWADTLEILERELWHLDAEHVVVEVDVPERGVRIDGQLRSDAKAASPAVRLAFDSQHGPLTYATDRFIRPSWQQKGAREHWQHNLRAITLGLEALRKVDRYGITRRGEQYAGWKALPSGSGDAIAMPTAMTVEDAARLVLSAADEPAAYAGDVIAQPEVRKMMVRRATLRTHPDHGGDRAAWDRLQHARAVLDDHAALS